MLTIEDIHRWLILASRGLLENEVLSLQDIERRAQSLFEGINQIEFVEFKVLGLRELKCLMDGRRVTLPLVEYSFGEDRNHIDNASPIMRRSELAKIRCMQGTGLDRGDLAYLGKVFEIGRRTIPHLWLTCETLCRNLRTPRKHISTLNEVWWLGLWPTLDSNAVEHEVVTNPRSLSTVDWRFPLRGTGFATIPDVLIHLEVKQLLSTFTTTVHGFSGPVENLFRGVEDKYRPSTAGEINIVAVTIMCEIDNSVKRIVRSRLEMDELIDAVCVWSPVAQNQSFSIEFNPRLDARNHKRGVVEASIARPSLEDAQVSWLEHPDMALVEKLFGKMLD